MEQRPLRVGDNVDDYCPRERRITSHVIVALVETAIRQTRCSACDCEHVFKAGLSPRPKRRDEGTAPAEVNGNVAVPGDPVPRAAADARPPGFSNGHQAMNSAEANQAGEAAKGVQPDDPRANELWSGHRPLIRATLPRVDGGEPPARAIPEFTMHQRNVRGSHAFRQGQAWHDRPGDPVRGPRHGSPFGSGGGPGNGGPGTGRGHQHRGNGEADGNGGDSLGNGNGQGAGGNRPPGRRRRRRGHRKPPPQ